MKKQFYFWRKDNLWIVSFFLEISLAQTWPEMGETEAFLFRIFKYCPAGKNVVLF